MNPTPSKEDLSFDITVTEHQENIILALTGYLEAYPNNKVSSDTLKIYAKALYSLSVNQIHAAMMKILRESKFFPSISEILDEAEKITDYLQGVSVPTAGEAWQEVMNNAKKYHIYERWHFSYPLIQRAAEYFGIKELCTIPEKDISIARAQFMRIYESIVSQNREKQKYADIFACLPKKIVTELTKIGDVKSMLPIHSVSSPQKSVLYLI